ncbi:SusC/RagA family TonB-linked outer membrane protein [Wenyingzhuangia aestuarii]|uniref:SusC/RagA family TonB-linked outer membrane protein n=1 Tax=Wenyingzhuangia aestuarii TaxID=1647582 RepID=UPI00143C1B06|nr:SusC/RagA family TonB-linked outer membrane protein [Wenyingzhuangia aestuarii]NJB83085.1 TonB-linked SusC/RagA family outer membrane protein [Wenyingzhuangia aestuarii]
MKLLFTSVLFILSLSLFAQKTITGTIFNKKDKSTIAFVTINDTEGNQAISNENGVFTITTNQNTLTFSSIGFIDETLSVKNKTTLTVFLTENTTELNEIVITALGVKQEKKELGYSVQTLRPKDIAQVKTVNFLDNLSGKIAGVQVTRGATGVGSSSKITIRGESSFSNNNPLFIVDGTPINNNTIFNTTNEAAAGFQEVDFGNGAMEVNADDIASVTVLKGPSAAALYGTRAANGVIVITTKNGEKSNGLGIEINSSSFIDTAFKLPKFQNQYGQGQSGVFEFKDGLGAGISDNITYSWGPKLDTNILIPQFDSPVTLPDGTIVRGGDTSLYNNLPITATPFTSNPNNLKDFYKTGFTTINNIAISNGFDKGNYRLSLTDLNSESIIPGVNLKRKTAFAKINVKPSLNTVVNVSASYTQSESDNRPSNGYGSENVNYSLVAWGPRSLNINSLKNYWQPGLEDRQQFSYNYTFFDNPYFILQENRNSFNRDRVFGNINIQQNFNKYWSLKLRSGIDYSSEIRQFRRAFSSNRFKNGGYAEHNVYYKEINSDFLINYKNKYNQWKIDVSFGGNTLKQTANTSQAQTISLAQPGIFNLNNAASPIDVFQQTATKKINSLYGIAKFKYSNLVYIDITGRNDWSSALATPFGADNTSFFYPSISSSFIVSNAVKLPEYISFAKLRASVAQVGNDTNPYQTSSVFNSQTTVNGNPTFSSQDFIPNENLKPESTTAYEIGGVVNFFNNRFNVDVTYYNSTTKDQIISLPIPVSSGYNQQVVNGGKVRTQGVEILLNTTPFKTKDFTWNVLFNFNSTRSKILDLPQQDSSLTLAYSRIYDSANQTVYFQVEKGGRIGDFYGTGYLKNENGYFVIDGDGNFIADNTLKKLGNYNPDFTLGWTNNFSYKNWNANFVFDWSQGGKIVSRTRALGNVGGQLAETSHRPTEGIVAKGVVNTGTAENPIYVANTTAISAESYYRQYYDRNHEENNIYNASFLKLRQISIGYSFPLKKGSLGLKDGANIKVSLIGKNLFAFTENPHFDPEQIAVQGNGFVSGVEDLSYATTKSYGINLGLKF